MTSSSADVAWRVPPLGVGSEPLRLSLWLVEVGEEFVAGDRLVELRIPGVTCDLPAPCAGRLQRVVKSAGDRLAEGDLLGWIHPVDVVSDESAESEAPQ